MSSELYPNTNANIRSTKRESLEVIRALTTSIVFSAGVLAVDGVTAAASKTRAGLVHTAETVKQRIDSVRTRLETVVLDHDSMNTLGGSTGAIFDEPPQEQVMYASDSGFPPGHVQQGDIQI